MFLLINDLTHPFFLIIQILVEVKLRGLEINAPDLYKQGGGKAIVCILTLVTYGYCTSFVFLSNIISNSFLGLLLG